MHNIDLILTLTGGLTAALLMGYLTHRLGLSPIVGYLLAGVLVGPSTPGYVANIDLAEQMAEVGVILLMFGVGLQFHFKELLAVRRVAVPGAVTQSLVATVLGALLAVAAGWGWSAGLVFGLAISVASTVVLVRVLSDNNSLHSPAGHIAVGWLVVEDLFTVLVLVLLPVLFQPDGAEAGGGVALALVWSFVKIGLLVAFVFLAGGRLIPWILTRVAATRSRELFTLTVLVVALGIAVGAAKVFGVSMALGAFLAGMVGRSDFSSRAAAEALPMRDAFAVLFFVSVGMLFDPAYVLESPALMLATLAIILLGKPAAALAIVLVMGYPLRVALSVAVALAQIGEFSFILASLGTQLGILPPAATIALVAASIVSISVNPILYRLVDYFEARLKAMPRLHAWLTARAKAHLPGQPDKPSQPENGAIVVGLWTGGPHPGAPPEAERDRADYHRPESGDRTSLAGGGISRRLWRRDAQADARGGRSRAGGGVGAQLLGHARQRGNDPPGPRGQLRDTRLCAGGLLARSAAPAAGRRRRGLRRRG